MFMAQALSADRSCQRAVNDLAVNQLHGGLKSCSTHTGGYCRARQRLPVEMVSRLVRGTGNLISICSAQAGQWMGKPIRLVDGTTVTMSDTKANQAAYPQSRGQKAGLGFPICRLVGIVCLSSGTVLDAALGRFRGKGGDEQTLLRSILDTLNTGDVLFGDAITPPTFCCANCSAEALLRYSNSMVPAGAAPTSDAASAWVRAII